MRTLVLAGALLLTACTPRGPHVEYICTASHTDINLIPVAMPNGSGGVMMQMMPMPEETCDAGYNACVNEGKKVDNKMCEVKN